MKKENPSLGLGPKIHPGIILKKYFLDDRQLSQSRFAEATGLPVSRINDIIKGRRGITVDAAIRFARALGMSEGFWINAQTTYERCCAQEEKGAEYAVIKPLPLPQPSTHAA
jgi:antitoxin HigA-1